MKKYLLTALLSISVLFLVHAQDESNSSSKSNWYVTSGGEMIFSLWSPADPSNDATVIRWAPVFNSQTMLNTDISPSFGIYTGLAIRNVGFIADDPDSSDIRRKFRTYNVAVPLGIKVGNLNGTFLYAGVDGEYAFNYKEKTFDNDGKREKSVYWFSNRVNEWQAAVHLGFQFYRGSNIKFKYYLTKFFNEDRDIYAAEYQRFDGNVFYFSLNTNLFYNTKFYYK
jgi:hypothetical protein